MARKPVEGTVANNVLTYGTGGINIDAGRIGFDNEQINFERIKNGNIYGSNGIYGNAENTESPKLYKPEGRWPANVIFDEHSAALLDEQSGQTKSQISNRGNINIDNMAGYGDSNRQTIAGTGTIRGHNDSGGASRFFYVARASKADRNDGLENLPTQNSQHDSGGLGRETSVNKRLEELGANVPTVKNFHPTVKPTTLMEYLIKLVTPQAGTVLDPFTGSGSTGKAALLNGYQFIGIELTEEYLPIIEGRLKWAYEQATKAAETPPETTLF
jgi:site-specific DNA-methyltransferase (adenine-specific)